MTLDIGTPAPNFKGRIDSEKYISLSDFKGKMNVVLYFYPKDNSPGCTREACKFRDEIEDFQKLDAVVIGVNRAGLDSHKKFIEKRELPFEIISDSDGAIYRSYDVKGGFISERVTYIIDKEGIIRGVFNSQMKYLQHPDYAREVLDKISKDNKEVN